MSAGSLLNSRPAGDVPAARRDRSRGIFGSRSIWEGAVGTPLTNTHCWELLPFQLTHYPRPAPGLGAGEDRGIPPRDQVISPSSILNAQPGVEVVPQRVP